MSTNIICLQNWLKNLKKDVSLTPQQYFALEKAITLAISTFQNVKDVQQPTMDCPNKTIDDK